MIRLFSIRVGKYWFKNWHLYRQITIYSVDKKVSRLSWVCYFCGKDEIRD